MRVDVAATTEAEQLETLAEGGQKWAEAAAKPQQQQQQQQSEEPDVCQR